MILKSKKIFLKDFRLNELEDYIVSLGEPKFRGKQIFNWMYDNLVENFSEMANLPIALREKLNELSQINTLKLVSTQGSKSTETVKYLFETFDGKKIESVIIPENGRRTLCISTQIGCPLDCKFCATGLMGYIRNLSAGEIIDQYIQTR